MNDLFRGFALKLESTKLVWWRGLFGVFGALALAGAAHAEPIDFQGAYQMMPFDEEVINYSKTAAHDPVAILQKRLASDELTLKHDEETGYLRSLLAELKIPVSSQMLVFSKTSLQRHLISPRSPRALFFNDDVYIGWIPGAPLIEIASADPKLGGIFYTLEQEPGGRPKLERNNQCLECHASSRNMGVPGHLARSFVPDERGNVDLFSGSAMVNHRTPFAKRWGGWYVSGQHGNQAHMGNLAGEAAFAQQEKTPNYLANLDHLSRFFNTSKYPAPYSDIVALMVFEHQAHGHNFITRLHYESQMGLKMYGHVRYTRTIVEGLLRYLLFVDEVALTSPVKGPTKFAEEFQKRGPRDSKGRSLRDLDLQTRMFKHPCSYLIYSDALDTLPAPTKEMFYQRLHDILTGKDTTAELAALKPADRQAILDILLETHPPLPAS
ncbi:MAG: hypothetical protein AB1705_28325, partial [Verrucomicrobiota bacterium]